MSDDNKSGGSFSCIPLKWDTDYFGVSCARVNLPGPVTETEQEEILNFCRSFDFVTIANLYNRSENNLWIGRRTDAFLADVNIQFIKTVDKNTGKKSLQQNTADKKNPDRQVYRLELNTGEIVLSNSFEADLRLLDIAGKAFSYSRFFNDPFLPADLVAGIYRQWCRNAFMREDKYFAVYYREHEPAGFLMFGTDLADGCRIELVAVKDKYRGQGIGRALLAACEAFCASQAISSIRLGTQADNLAAIRLYLGSGFIYSHCSSIYHMWN